MTDSDDRGTGGLVVNGTRGPRWTDAETDAYELARALLDAVIAAYSDRIGSASSPEAALALREERAPLLAERETLGADDRARIAEIVRGMPDRLASVRRGAVAE